MRGHLGSIAAMPRQVLLWIGALLLSPAVVAQDTTWQDDLAFVESLRARNDSDLALEYLERMAKTATPELRKELTLEFARTRVRVATQEPDSSKRLALFAQARADFENFIKVNPDHPRVAEANLDIARILALQGRTELNRAILAGEREAKQAEAARARGTLELAGTRFAAALAELQKSPGKHSEDDLAQTQLEQALNIYDRAETYIGRGDAAASKLLSDATTRLKPLAGGPENNPATWKARAWLGRIIRLIETDELARRYFQEVIDAKGSAPREGQRLAKYFLMLVVDKKPIEAETAIGKDIVLRRAGESWLRSYASYRNTPEGYGVAFLLAEVYVRMASNMKLAKKEQDTLLDQAVTLLRSLEASENEFTERARNLKISIKEKQGLFTKKIDDLKTFEDCYVRAQYELFKMSDAKEDKTRNQHIDDAMTALRKAIALAPAGANAKGNLELATAKSTLTYWALNTGKYEDAIKTGEEFAHSDPRASQAASSAVYALEAYAKVIARLKTEEDIQRERARMLRLAQYMENRWPQEAPGNLGRHQLGLQLLREEQYPEALKKLSTITPGYPSYAYVQYQIGEAALKAERTRAELIIGDRKGDYRKRGLWALEQMPEPTEGSEPGAFHVYVMGKAMLGREWFPSKRYADMQTLSTGLLAKMAKWKLSDDPKKDQIIRDQLAYELTEVGIYARYGLADAAYSRNDLAAVSKIIDPLVDELNKPVETLEKAVLQKNRNLAMPTLSLALRANLLLNKIDRTDMVLEAMDKLSAGELGGDSNPLKLLAALIHQQIGEISKRGDTKALDTARKGFTLLLDKRIAKQGKSLTPDFILLLANCYSSMEQHEKAATELAKVPEPPAGAPEEKAYRGSQLLLLRELRLAKTDKSLEKASEVLDKIMGSDGRPTGTNTKPGPRGWGRSDLVALKEKGMLLEAQGEFRKAFDHWQPIVKQLAKASMNDNNKKTHYYECFYHMIFSYYKTGEKLPDQARRAHVTKTAVQQIVTFEKSFENFGDEANARRFTELLAQEKELREAYETAKGGAK
jgi:hypothetical protein